ncbi:hypothetical protein D3C87_1984440 [compost metagenome]
MVVARNAETLFLGVERCGQAGNTFFEFPVRIHFYGIVRKAGSPSLLVTVKLVVELHLRRQYHVAVIVIAGKEQKRESEH